MVTAPVSRGTAGAHDGGQGNSRATLRQPLSFFFRSSERCPSVLRMSPWSIVIKFSHLTAEEKARPEDLPSSVVGSMRNCVGSLPTSFVFPVGDVQGQSGFFFAGPIDSGENFANVPPLLPAVGEVVHCTYIDLFAA